MKYLERRKNKRFQSRFPVHFLKKMNALTKQIKQLGFASNISMKGVCLLTANKLDIGDVLDLVLSLPGENSTQKITITGVVRWGQSVANSSNPNETKPVWNSDFTYCNGIEFLDKREEININNFIVYLQSIVA